MLHRARLFVAAWATSLCWMAPAVAQQPSAEVPATIPANSPASIYIEIEAAKGNAVGRELRSVPRGDVRGAEFYETHIRPLLSRACYSCHSQRTDEIEGGLTLDQPDSWLTGGDQGPSVVPGDVEASLLIQAVRYQDAATAMPPSQPLSEAEVQKLEQWVRMGAPGPTPEMALQDALHNSDPSDPIAGRQHWAFQILQRPTIPNVKNSDWPWNPIDQFILAKADELGLQPVEDALPADLLRRLSYQLHGLPPSRASSDLFAAAYTEELSHEQAIAQTVEAMLAAPQFGERWGRHWLDLARYADSNGLDENFLFREAWRYRNWVFDATNDDMPYDRFLLEQFAGDLLPYESLEQRDRQRIAAGYLVIGPKVLLGLEREQQRMDVADEHIDTLGRAILGQTLGCARCHDHKFDPIPTADYYALAGVFASTRVMEKRYMLGEQRLMEQLIGLGPDGKDADDAYELYWRERPTLTARAEKAQKALGLFGLEQTDALAKLIEDDALAVAEGAQDANQPAEQRVAAQQTLVDSLKKSLAEPPPIPPRGMIPSEAEQVADEAIRLAGQAHALGDVVPRGFLTVLSSDRPGDPATLGSTAATVEPVIPVEQSGRLQLAHWLTDSHNRSGQLAARVVANRIWKHLMGRGLVRTVDNFGRTGEEPTHPELLDYLAMELIESGWSIKALVRQIATSHSFALSSHFDAENAASDPENKYLWRAHRRRLEPEALRDAMLIAAGQLDQLQYDSTVDYLGDQATAVGTNPVRRRTDFPCRSVYLPVIRNDLPEVFEALDFTNPHMTTGARPQTIVPAQGLYLLNEPQVMQAAQQTAERVLAESPSGDRRACVEQLYVHVIGATPTQEILDGLMAYVLQVEQELQAEESTADAAADAGEDAGEDDAANGKAESNKAESKEDIDRRHRIGGAIRDAGALARACHALFASSRFQFVE